MSHILLENITKVFDGEVVAVSDFNMEIQKVREFYDNWVDYLKDIKPRHEWIFKSIDKYIPSDCRVLDLGCGRF